MVKISHRAIKEIVILDYTQYEEVEQLVRIVGLSAGTEEPLALLWVEGVLFTYSALHAGTDELVKELLEGKVYWTNVSFVLAPKYQPTIELKGISMPVLDATPNESYREVAIWLKAQARKGPH